MDYTTIALIVMLLCFSLSVLFVVLYFKDDDKGRAKWGFSAFGLFVVGFIMFYSVLGLAMEEVKEGPCEWLVNNTATTNSTPTSSTTTYDYFYTCETRTSYGWLEAMFILVTWLLYALFIACLLIPVIYLVRLAVKKS